MVDRRIIALWPRPWTNSPGCPRESSGFSGFFRQNSENSIHENGDLPVRSSRQREAAVWSDRAGMLKGTFA